MYIKLIPFSQYDASSSIFLLVSHNKHWFVLIKSRIKLNQLFQWYHYTIQYLNTRLTILWIEYLINGTRIVIE